MGVMNRWAAGIVSVLLGLFLMRGTGRIFVHYRDRPSDLAFALCLLVLPALGLWYALRGDRPKSAAWMAWTGGTALILGAVVFGAGSIYGLIKGSNMWPFVGFGYGAFGFGAGAVIGWWIGLVPIFKKRSDPTEPPVRTET